MKKLLFLGTSKIMGGLIKKSIFIFLLIILSNITSFSLRTYFKQNLQQASHEELNTYLKLSNKKKLTGTIMSVAITLPGVQFYLRVPHGLKELRE